MNRKRRIYIWDDGVMGESRIEDEAYLVREMAES
jgi:hypothetical protein